MVINNEIQYSAAINRFNYLESLDKSNVSEVIEWTNLITAIYEYEEKHHPIDIPKSDT